MTRSQTNGSFKRWLIVKRMPPPPTQPSIAVLVFYDPELLIGVDCISLQDNAANSLKC
jgi:hypothetical protein